MREGIEVRLSAAETKRAGAFLPNRVRGDRTSVRVLMLQRLAFREAGARSGSALARAGRGGRPSGSTYVSAWSLRRSSRGRAAPDQAAR